MSDTLRVLVVEDDERIRSVLEEALGVWGFAVAVASTAAEAVELVQARVFDVVLSDVRLPGADGLELLRELKRRDPAVEVVMMTGYPTVTSAVEALKLGAYDYLTKPVSLDELRHLLDRLTERRFLRREVTTLRRRLGERQELPQIVGTSAEMERVRSMIQSVAPADSPVLIEGESGTGKELVAVAIHRLSPRSRGPFIPINCGAIPPELMESEFFGHVRGAFSGAVADQPGLFRSADTGTIFLDEVAELPPVLQVKLLRVLEDKEVRPVGSVKSYPVEVRVVAATNRQLEQSLRDGTFRQDLFYRLNVVRIAIAPLRARKGDIPVLVTHFLRLFNQRFGRDVRGLTAEALAALTAYEFPGNVRELENLLERAYALGARGEITLADLPALSAYAPAAGVGELPKLADVERELILRALALFANDKDRAARALGLSRRTIYRRLKEYGLF